MLNIGTVVMENIVMTTHVSRLQGNVILMNNVGTKGKFVKTINVDGDALKIGSAILSTIIAITIFAMKVGIMMVTTVGGHFQHHMEDATRIKNVILRRCVAITLVWIKQGIIPEEDVIKIGTVVKMSFVTIIVVKIHVLELVVMGQTVKCFIELLFVPVQVVTSEML